MHADQILFLEEGHIVEQGSHAELLARAAATARSTTCRTASYGDRR